jgi:steroid 5-alpha reductase family enzyme
MDSNDCVWTFEFAYVCGSAYTHGLASAGNTLTTLCILDHLFYLSRVTSHLQRRQSNQGTQFDQEGRASNTAAGLHELRHAPLSMQVYY